MEMDEDRGNMKDEDMKTRKDRLGGNERVRKAERTQMMGQLKSG